MRQQVLDATGGLRRHLPGSGNQYVDVVDGLATANEYEARFIACVFLFLFGTIIGGMLGDSYFGGKGAVIGIFTGAAADLGIGYFLGLFLVRLTAFWPAAGSVLWLVSSKPPTTIELE